MAVFFIISLYTFTTTSNLLGNVTWLREHEPKLLENAILACWSHVSCIGDDASSNQLLYIYMIYINHVVGEENLDDENHSHIKEGEIQILVSFSSVSVKYFYFSCMPFLLTTCQVLAILFCWNFDFGSAATQIKIKIHSISALVELTWSICFYIHM